MIHFSEAKTMVDVQYARGFSDALEYVFNVFNKLSVQDKLQGECENCRLMEEIGKLRSFAKDREFEKIESELGYYLP